MRDFGDGGRGGDYRHAMADASPQQKFLAMGLALENAVDQLEHNSTRFSTYESRLSFLNDALPAWEAELPSLTTTFSNLGEEPLRLLGIMKQKLRFLQSALRTDMEKVCTRREKKLGPAELIDMREQMKVRVADFWRSIDDLKQYLPE